MSRNYLYYFLNYIYSICSTNIDSYAINRSPVSKLNRSKKTSLAVSQFISTSSSLFLYLSISAKRHVVFRHIYRSVTRRSREATKRHRDDTRRLRHEIYPTDDDADSLSDDA